MKHTDFDSTRKSGDDAPPVDLVARHGVARLRQAVLVEGTARRDALSVLRAASLNAATLTPFAAGQEWRLLGAAAGQFALFLAELYLLVWNANEQREHQAVQHARGVLAADERVERERRRLNLERAQRSVRNAALVDLANDLGIPVVG